MSDVTRGSPLARWLEWFESLPVALRSHLAEHLFDVVGLPAIDRRMTGYEPDAEAELALELASRTDVALGDPAVRDPFADGEIERATDWVRAAEAWAELRASSLAHRRITRWLEKRTLGAA